MHRPFGSSGTARTLAPRRSGSPGGTDRSDLPIGVLDSRFVIGHSAPVAVWRFFASTKQHSDCPEVIERPLGTTILYVVLCLCLFGCIAGLVPIEGDCKLTCSDETHGNFVITVVSASIALLLIALLVWSRRQEHRARRCA